MEKKFIQYSLKAYKFSKSKESSKTWKSNKIISFKAWDVYKLYTLSKLVIYTFTFRYSLTSRAFPQA